ncbi:regulatory protein RecX [Maribellus maritimus]|uniref:regulatory protein RecX n=1 Tax=Maribellus maritimus TaxID=2870838 RepID=UPI001EECC766|nr:regulatory protein RecX [Maribellus maritimus]MCG6188645.1 RecX family transcriptional regulator [Maribellus maritimus]
MSNEETNKKQVISNMAALCSRSEQCSPDIYKKIIAAGLTDEEAVEILNYLKQEKYIDDERYVNAYVAEKFKINKWGRIKMKYYLRMKGLPDDVIQNGLESIDEKKYIDLLLKTMKEKARKIKNKSKFEKMGQIIRYTQSRGFEPELIHRYMNMILE